MDLLNTTPDQSITNLPQQNIRLNSNIVALQNKNDELECYSRRNNLIFVGIPSAAAEVVNADTKPVAENLTLLVTKVLNIMKDRMRCDITANDISIADLLSRNSENGSLGPLPVVERLFRCSQRGSLCEAKRELKNASLEYKMYVNEDLFLYVRKLCQEVCAKSVTIL